MKPRWPLALVLVLGCSFDSGTVPTIDNSCSSDSGCSEGVCDGSICIDESGATVDLAIEVLRGATDMQVATPASWAFAAEPATGSSRRDLVLPATRQVVGTVRWNGARVPATLRFVRKMNDSVAPLAPVAIEVDTLPERLGANGSESNDFSTILVAGAIYELVVLPSSDMIMVAAQEPEPAIRALPPVYLELPIEGGDPGDPFRVDIAFPAGLSDKCTDQRKTGCTFSADVVSADDEAQMVFPEAGLQVRAIDERSGRLVSSIAETDSDGHFAIRVSDDASDYSIRITSNADRSSFPAVSVYPDVVFANNPVDKIISIPRLAPLQVTGEVRDKLGRAIPVATVRFVSTNVFLKSEPGLVGSFSGSVKTNEDGSFGTELLAGFYSITATPPEDIENDWGVLSGGASINEDQTTIDPLVVPWQIGLRGKVSTFRDEYAAGVTISARARSSMDPGASHRSQEAVSSDLGDFEMSVDIGLYDVHAKVPAESGFAWLVEPEVLLSLTAGDLRRDYRLEPPVAVYGVIRTSEGEAVPNALVRGHLFDGGSDGSAARPLQVAEALSDEDGSYRLLIAPRFGAE